MIAQTFKNMQRHFLVWGTLAVIVMFAGISENQSGTPASEWDRTPAIGTLADVLSKHKCKDTKEGEFPSAIIAREIGGGFIYSSNPRMVGAALDEQFADKDWHGYEVRYFCR